MSTYLTLNELSHLKGDFTAFPSPKDEAWRFTPFELFLEHPFEVEAHTVHQSTFAYKHENLLRFENTQLVSQFLPLGISCRVVKQKRQEKSYAFFDALEHLNGKTLQLRCEETATIAINNTFGAKGVYRQDREVYVAKNVSLTLVDCFESGTDAFIAMHTKFHLEEGATIRYIKLSLIDKSSAMVAYNDLDVAKNAKAILNPTYHGGKMIWDYFQSSLHQRSSLEMNALIFGDDHHDTTLVAHCQHLQSESHSKQRCKQILQNSSHAVFDTTSVVDHGTKKCEVLQKSAALLLDESSQVHSKPHLKIYTDDLAASHGSTVGALDEDALFYLQSRGLSLQESQAILIDAFAGEMLESIEIPQLIEAIKTEMGVIM